MRKRQYILSVLMGTILSFGLEIASCQSEHPTQVFMRQKLNYAQGILEGITMEKYELILTNATLMRNMSQTNAFRILGNLDYLQRVTNFQANVDALTAAAKARNLERSAGAYSLMTRSCVDCHKFFRREQFVRRQVESK